jgi:hypothetical protein
MDLTAILGALSGLFGGGESSASNMANKLTLEQIHALRAQQGRLNQWGDPMLKALYNYALQGRTAAMNANEAQGLEGIRNAYQPAYGKGLAALSQRGLLTSPSSGLNNMVGGMDRARAAAESRYATQNAERINENLGSRMGTFGNALGMVTGQGTNIANSFAQPASTYAGLAAQSGGSPWQDALAALAKYTAMKPLSAAQTGPATTTSTAAPYDWLKALQSSYSNAGM